MTLILTKVISKYFHCEPAGSFSAFEAILISSNYYRQWTDVCFADIRRKLQIIGSIIL